MENKPDWTSFTRRIHIQKPTQLVFDAWTQKRLLETWFLEIAEFKDSNGVGRKPIETVQQGDTFSWKWNNWPHREEGEVLNIKNKELISFTFGPGGIVDVHLKESKFGTEVTLIQKQIPSDDKHKMDLFVGCYGGWTFWLANLKAWMEHGITLHATGLSEGDTTNLVNS